MAAALCLLRSDSYTVSDFN